MNEFVVLRQFIPKSGEIFELIKHLDFGYDDPGVFEEHKRFPISWDTYIPVWLTNFNKNLLDTLIRITNCSIVTDFILINKYESNEGCDWHRDYDEPWCNNANNKAIKIVLTLGPDKIFRIRNNDSKEIQEYNMKCGDVIIFGEGFDETHQHSVPIHNDNLTRYTYMMTLEINANQNDSFFDNLNQYVTS